MMRTHGTDITSRAPIFASVTPAASLLLLAGALLLPAATPVAAQPYTVWSATLTVDSVSDLGTFLGCDDLDTSLNNCSANLTRQSFTYSNTAYTVNVLYNYRQSSTNALSIGFNKAVPTDTLVLFVDGRRFSSDSALVENDDDSTVTGGVWSWSGAGLTWSDGDTVDLRLVWEGTFPPDPATPTLTPLPDATTNTTLSFEIGCVSGHVTDYILWVTRPNSRLEPGAHYFSPFAPGSDTRVCPVRATVENLEKNTTYNVQVRARTITGGKSLWSGPADYTTANNAGQVQGGGTSDPDPTDDLTASFEQVPDEHDGKAQFSFLVRLSETVGNFSKSPRAESFEVTRGRVRSVEQADAGLWRVRVKPNSWRKVGVTLAGGKDCDDAGAVCTPDIRPLSNTVTATVPGPAGLKVAGGKAREGRDEAIDFAVTLTRAASGTATVDYATADETATAGTDYEATSGTLTFAPGETEKTVRVAILDDLIDEGQEIFRLRLSNASGARIADGKAAGKIGNTDPGQAAWLSRFGRAVAAGMVDAVGERIDRRAQVRSQSGATDLSLLRSFVLSAAGGRGGAGSYGSRGYGTDYAMAGDGFGPGYPNAAAGYPTGMAGHHDAVGLGGPMTGGAVGGGSYLGNSMPMGPAGADRGMALPSGSLYVPGGDGNRWTGWARTSVGHFSSAGPGAAVALSGQMRMGIFGTDYQMGRMLAGVAVAHGRGGGSLSRDGLDRAYRAHSALTSVHPYVAFDLSEDLTVWGQGGWGRGEMTLSESVVRSEGMQQAGAYRAGSGLSMLAAGVRGGLPELGGFQLAVKSDAFLVRTASDAVVSRGAGNLAAAEAGVSRVRAALEGSRELRFAGGRSITPSVELGVRQDGGDAETGTGLETGFGVVFADPNLGLMVDAMLNLLVAHQDSRYEEWGFTGSVRFDTGLSGRGLSLTMTPSFGMASQGADRLWAMQDMGGLIPYGAVPFDMGGQLAADVGYGMEGPGGRGTGTPYAGLTQSGVGYRALRYGWRWAVDQRFNVGVEGARQGGFGGMLDHLGNGAAGLGRVGDAAHSVQFRGGVTF